ncbi:MAG: quinol monooxygenase YgiN [Cognaticolwellia sp.]
MSAELLKLIVITRAETVCIYDNLHQNNANPARFMFYENWETPGLWQAHMTNEY